MLITINRQEHPVPSMWENESLLDFLRDHLGLTGSKFGCGAGLCGACTVMVNGAAERSCTLNLKSLGGAKVQTIEGLAPGPDQLHPLQQAWIDHAVPQCGYCQAGQIMNAVAFLKENPSPTDEEIDAAMTGNLCRCGAYNRIRAAIKTVVGRLE